MYNMSSIPLVPLVLAVLEYSTSIFSMTDADALRTDKYNGDTSVDLSVDLARLESGEPLAYVIGWIPFLGLRIELDSRPLIPRPETEWWVEQCIAEVRPRDTKEHPLRILDLCAGSGAVGLSLLKALPFAHVSFAELVPAHVQQIERNLLVNNLDASRATIKTSDLYSAFPNEQWDLILCNPPYIPSTRTLETSVSEFEPSEALFAGLDGLDLIRKISAEVPGHLSSPGEIWMECDVANIAESAGLLTKAGSEGVEIRTDQYGRPRIVVGYFS